MSLHILTKFSPTRTLLFKLSAKRAEQSIRQFASYLKPGESVLDIGAGTCVIAEQLKEKGHVVTALDITNLSIVPDMRSVIYDGQTIPFSSKSFDVSLLYTTLHHTPDPERILQEAARVSRKVIIVEDVYLNPIHKYATFFMDSLVNLEFFGHPHSNKTDKQWRETFKKLGLRLASTKSMKSLVIMRHKRYVLEV